MMAAMPPTRPAGGIATRQSSSLPSPSTRSTLEDLAALAARLLGAPWAAVRLGEGDDALDIIPSGLPLQAPPCEFGCSPATANWDDDTPRARIVLAGSTARALSTDEEHTLAALDRQAAALLALDRKAAEAQAGIAPHFKTLLDHLPTAAFIKDEDHRYTFANRAFWKLCNGTGEEGDLREVDESKRMTPETVERIRQRDLEVLQTGRKHEYIEKLEYDGKVHTWWVCKFPVAGPDGRPWVGGISLDISDLGQARAGSRMNELIFKNIEVGVTERRTVHDRLARSVERFELMARTTNDGLFEMDLAGGTEWWNERLSALLGFGPGQAPSGGHAWADLIHPMDRERVSASVRDAISGRDDYFAREFRVLRPDGEVRHIHARCHVVRDEAGKPLRLLGAMLDLTASKLAEEAVRENEERYRLLFHGSPLPMYLVDLETLRFADVNRAAEIQYGYSRAEFLSMTLKDIRPAEDAPYLREKARRFSTESGSLGIWRHRRKDGTLIQAAIDAHLLEASGGPSLVMVVAQDVTERLQAIERISLSEERYRTLARVSPVGLFRTDLQGNCLYVNEHCAQIVGMPADRLEGRGWMNIFHPEDGKRAAVEWERAFSRGRPYHAEFRVLRPDGRVLWVDSRALIECGPGGTPIGYVGTLMDITERKQAETLLAGQKRVLALIASGAALGSILDELLGFVEKEGSGLAGGVLLSDAESGDLMWASAPGLPAALRHSMNRLPAGPEGGPAGLAAAERRAVDCPQICAEATWLCGRGEALEHGFRSCLARPILSTSGGLLGILVCFSRAHGRPGAFVAKLLETALDLAGIAVERRRQEEIARLNQELSEDNRRILEANRMKSEFLASMSHELRTPLNAIIGFSQLLIDRKVGPLNDKQGEYMGDILDGGMHLLRLINDVLDLAKIESGKMQLFLEPVPVLRAVREVCDILMPMALAKSIGFRMTANLDPETAVLDSQKFKQILYNLLSNAIKFSHQGGTVAISAARDAGGVLCLEVADRGIGIRKEDLGRLFQEFQQLDTGAARHFPGTGLGLVITKKLVELHRGSVGVESRPGEGSVFSAVFPPLELPEE